MIHLRSVRYVPGTEVEGPPRGYPFSLAVLQGLAEIKLKSAVTFFVGENGSGKSTMIEAIAAGLDMIAIGADDLARDPSLHPARLLGDELRFTWSKRTRKGFFLRAEDFFGYARRLKTMKTELGDLAKEYEETFDGEALSRSRAMALGQRDAIERKYGGDLDARSHGESFLALFQSRFVPGGLYLLDEPEAPLSPVRQLALLAMIQDMVGQNAQFVVATHSPILMAFPGAEILDFDRQPLRSTPWDELEHVTLTRAFLNDPQAFLRRL